MSDYENKLQHLSAEQMEQLYEEYLAGEKNAVLVERYGIDLPPNCLIKAFPPLACNALACPYCVKPMYQRRKSKGVSDAGPAFCKSCAHRHYPPSDSRWARRCGCKPCLAERAEHKHMEQAQRQQKIYQQWSLDRIRPLPYRALSFTRKLQLMALLLTRANLLTNRFTPVADSPGDARVTPSQAMDEALLQALRDEQILALDPYSSEDAFSSGSAMVPRLDRVHWIANISLETSERASLSKLHAALYQDLSQGPLPQWRNEIIQAIRNLAVEEVYAYIATRCADHDLPFEAWKKSREVATQLLEQLPVRSIWSLTNTAIRGALSFAAQCRVNKRIASNTIPGRMLSLGERAVLEQWPFRWSGHDVKAPRSGLCQALYGSLLKGADFGLDSAIHEYIQALPTLPSPPVNDSDSLHCVACGSDAVHAQVKEREIIINCKDCMGRSVLLQGG